LTDLPYLEQAVVRPEKLTGYLLSHGHPHGQNKARFFEALGFSAAAWRVLADALVAHARTHGVKASIPTPFGVRYVVEGELATPVGRNPVIRAIWFVETDASAPYFVTAYPVKEERP
jgi:hypothetical protein